MSICCATAAAWKLEYICIICHRIGHWNCIRFTNATLDWSNTFNNLTSDQLVTCTHRIFESNIDSRESTCFSQKVHLAFVRKTSLYYAKPSHCSTRWIVCAHRITVDNCVVTLVWTLCVRDAIDQYCRGRARVSTAIKDHA